MTMIDRLYECIEAGGFDSLTAEEESLFALYWLFTEGYNGGLHQFFFNDSGKLAVHALRGLEMVGADQTADIFRRAIATFPNGHVPTDLGKRRELLVDDAYYEQLGTLTTEFFGCHEDVAELLEAYQQRHPGQFPCLSKP